jgi:K+-transporting ATPase KdpF subunit
VSAADGVGLALTVALLGYLFVALLRSDRVR